MKTNRFPTLQKQLSRRRLPAAAAVCLYMFLYYPAGIILQLTYAARNYASSTLTKEAILERRLTLVSEWLGLRQSLTAVTVLIAVVLALEGFSYLFSSEQLDFYESQPVARMERFRAIIFNSALIFEMPLIVCTALAVLAAALMGAMTPVIALEALCQVLRLTVIFFASSGLGVLCVMLCGGRLSFVVTAGVLFFIDSAYIYLIQNYMSAFFRTYTWYGRFSPRFSFSPLYNALAVGGYSLASGALDMKMLSTLIKAYAAPTLANLVLGCLFFAAAVILYGRRKAEYAGGTVIFKPVRTAIRVAVSVAAALFSCLLVYNMFYSSEGVVLAFLVIAALLAAVLACGVMQVIFEMNFRRFFGRFPEILAACAAALIIFFVFDLDLTGYDSYLPEASKVESASLYMYTEDTFDYEDYAGNEEITPLYSMELTDMDALLPLMETGMEAQRLALGGWDGVIAYRLAGGRTVYRFIVIPYDTDAQLIDAVVGSEQYSSALYPALSGEILADFEDAGTLYYYDGYNSCVIDPGLYEDFLEVYRSDAALYSYTLASTEEAVCEITANLYTDDEYLYADYSVYPSYTQTITFLEENGVPVEAPDAGDIEYIVVSAYTEDYDYSTAQYTDTEEISQILEASVNRVSDAWKSLDDTENEYTIEVKLFDNLYTLGGLVFKSGEVPGFVTDDLFPDGSDDGTEEAFGGYGAVQAR